MSTESAETRFTIAHRSSDGLEVTLTWEWEPAAERHKAVVCVFDERASTYFEIRHGDVPGARTSTTTRSPIETSARSTAKAVGSRRSIEWSKSAPTPREAMPS